MLARLLAVALLFALVVSGAALAARGDPQKKINAADQARAKAMLIRKSDLPAGFRATPLGAGDDDSYCKALDESDLTLTGEAEADFQARNPLVTDGVINVGSGGQVYESRADANASWRRGTSDAGFRCFRDAFRREFQDPGDRFISFRRVAFPRVTERTTAFRMIAETDGIRVQIDFIAFMQSRAHGGLFVGSLPSLAPQAEVVRLGRLVAARMKTAMRGA